ncbi:hypothetical protein ABGT24_25860 [Peribacillus frigoritolerans]|uniref:hypothetical protein n=1 Tax=Peribacillus frigoritolerans TaxID=450367 RepID=UPI00345D30EB
MKGKLVLTLGFAGVLAVSIGFAKDLQKTEAPAEVSSKQTDTYEHITREEHVRREGMGAEEIDVTTVLTAEEQNMVENSSAQQGFVPQENGTGFYFEKEKKN